MAVAEEAVEVVLPAFLDAEAAIDVARALREAHADGAPVRLNAAEVRRVATPAIQVLLAAGRSAQAAGRAFCIDQPTRDVVTAFEDLGLLDELNSWSLNHA
jgi:anti-anti-sigma regulatory factor